LEEKEKAKERSIGENDEVVCVVMRAKTVPWMASLYFDFHLEASQ